MIDLAQTLGNLGGLLPPLPQLEGAIPALQGAAELADAIGANPAPLLDAHQHVQQSHAQLGNILSTAVPLISAAIGDILSIGREFLTDAAKLLPRLLSPVPGDAQIAMSQLAALPGIALAKAGERIERLKNELMPSTQSLQEVATAPLPELPDEVPSPAGEDPQPAAAGFAPAGWSASGDGDNAAGEAAVAAAKSQIGVPYVWGGTTPGAGFDCSGLTQWAWRQAGLELPRLAQEQNIGRPVAYEELRAGDLLVWDGHVAMYDGAGSIVEAGDPVGVNPIRTTNMGMAFKGYFRPTG